jgi:hypothetical protein
VPGLFCCQQYSVVTLFFLQTGKTGAVVSSIEVNPGEAFPLLMSLLVLVLSGPYPAGWLESSVVRMDPQISVDGCYLQTRPFRDP